jgi:AhpD family alkylhydroperoxidase
MTPSFSTLARMLAAGSAIAFLAHAQTLPARAADTSDALAATYKDIEQTFGKVPDFLNAFPKDGLPGAWAELKAVEFSDGALTAKDKALISLAVSAQIPCHYCVWADTISAKQAGATDEQIKEAVATAALTRHWSTVFNGMQVDFDQFKKDLGGETVSAK